MDNYKFLVIKCSECGHSLGVNINLAGKKGLCPFCKSEIDIPSSVYDSHNCNGDISLTSSGGDIFFAYDNNFQCDGFIQIKPMIIPTKRSKLRIIAACLQSLIMLIHICNCGIGFFSFSSFIIILALLFTKGPVFRTIFFIGAWFYIAIFIYLLFNTENKISFNLLCGLVESILIAISIPHPKIWHDNYISINNLQK